MKLHAAQLTREHMGSEVIVRMGKDRVAGVLQQVGHFPDSVTVRIGSEHGHSTCCLDLDSTVEVA